MWYTRALTQMDSKNFSSKAPIDKCATKSNEAAHSEKKNLFMIIFIPMILLEFLFEFFLLLLFRCVRLHVAFFSLSWKRVKIVRFIKTSMVIIRYALFVAINSTFMKLDNIPLLPCRQTISAAAYLWRKHSSLSWNPRKHLAFLSRRYVIIFAAMNYNIKLGFEHDLGERKKKKIITTEAKNK